MYDRDFNLVLDNIKENYEVKWSCRFSIIVSILHVMIIDMHEILL